MVHTCQNIIVTPVCVWNSNLSVKLLFIKYFVIKLSNWSVTKAWVFWPYWYFWLCVHFYDFLGNLCSAIHTLTNRKRKSLGSRPHPCSLTFKCTIKRLGLELHIGIQGHSTQTRCVSGCSQRLLSDLCNEGAGLDRDVSKVAVSSSPGTVLARWAVMDPEMFLPDLLYGSGREDRSHRGCCC